MDNNELYHYGVLGMKWGVRNIKSSNGNKKIGYDDDVIIKRGAKAYRVSTKRKDTGDLRYITVDNNDRNYYKSTWGSALKGTAGVVGKDSKIYENKYKIKEDLISPSAKKRQKMACELLKNKEARDIVADVYMLNSLVTGNGWSVEHAKECMAGWKSSGDKYFAKDAENCKKWVNEEINRRDDAGKATMVLSAMGTSDRMKVLFGKMVVDAGYNATIDDHGADFGGKSKRSSYCAE